MVPKGPRVFLVDKAILVRKVIKALPVPLVNKENKDPKDFKVTVAKRGLMALQEPTESLESQVGKVGLGDEVNLGPKVAMELQGRKVSQDPRVIKALLVHKVRKVNQEHLANLVLLVLLVLLEMQDILVQMENLAAKVLVACPARLVQMERMA